MPGQHALLSASSAERWMACTPSARLEEPFPDAGSDYASEGTLAHAIAELKVRRALVETDMGTRTFNCRLKKLQADPLYSPEMIRYTDDYLDYIMGIVHGFASKPYINVEVKLDFSNYASEGFGTSDCIIICGNDLYVIDFKYGQGVPVSAENNPQMRLYALGALETYLLFYDIHTVHMVIFQPRLNNISEAVISRDELINWGVFTVRPRAKKAFAGEGDYVAGEHCRFCRAKAKCRARSDTMTALEAFRGALPPLLTDAEVGDILTRTQTLKSWVSDLEEYALSAVLAGGDVPGWKAVEGRSIRQFDDTDTVFSFLIASGTEEALLYERKPLALAGVEKLLGKKQFDEQLASHIIKPPGKPTLVPESDKRKVYNTNPTAAEVFNS